METSKRSRALVEAAAWRTRMTDTAAQSTAGFERWLAADPEHRRAWKRIESPLDFLGQHLNAPQILEWRREALARASGVGRSRAAGAWRGRTGLAAAVTFLVLGAAALWMLNRPDAYRTAPGERHAVTLPDGSRVSLDSDTEVRVKYSGRARELELRRGQARFDVAVDVQRPFSVRASDQKVIVLGTAFNIDRLGARTAVTLLEGRVVVVNGHAPQGVTLKPGEQLLALDGAGAPSVGPANLEIVSAWESGQLAFDNEPLTSVVQRVNRYSARRIEVADARAAALKVSGLFVAGDIDGFVGTVTHYLPLTSRADRGGRIRLQSR